MLNFLIPYSRTDRTPVAVIASSLAEAEIDSRPRHLRRLLLSQASCRSAAVGLGVVRDADQQVRGVVEGLIVDPSQRTIHGMVVRSIDSADEQCYLLPLHSVCARFDARTRCLEVEFSGTDFGQCGDSPIDPREFAAFSDDDWLDCLFKRAH